MVKKRPTSKPAKRGQPPPMPARATGPRPRARRRIELDRWALALVLVALLARLWGVADRLPDPSLGINVLDDSAIEETDRRRQKQVEYNAAHGITPQSVVRAVMDIMEGARDEPAAARAAAGKARRVADQAEDYAALDPAKLAGRLKALEQQMYQHARDLEFEEAARVRDEIRKIREATLAG